MSTLTIADLTKDAEREFRAALRDQPVLEACETFGEPHYRGGVRLVLANKTGSFEVVYSDMQLEVRLNGPPGCSVFRSVGWDDRDALFGDVDTHSLADFKAGLLKPVPTQA